MGRLNPPLAEMALGEGSGRIYIVEPTGPIEDDPNLTDVEARVEDLNE